MSYKLKHVSKRDARYILYALLCLPWLLLPFIGKNTFKTYGPAAIFMAHLIRIESEIAEKRNWWKIKPVIRPFNRSESPLIWGIFFIGSLVVLKWFYGRFWLYLGANLVLNALFSYPFYYIMRKLGIAKFVRLSRAGMMFLFLLKSIIMYGYHWYFIDSSKKSTQTK
ncbi:hypothetical protein [Mangrovibacillus cuniculi]|uniref:Uncharacterized protein n=1 Tax=Mangrovibacillus cuniculi TaxID=2593652 RepID=A0A7S8HF31_9BACI|nr:hypothetical protein [Mangrovibacillus cuniculi]QPC46489.1 hypothetical protein G8O30_05670 [Mangrovibacillus cuniculi]